MQPNKSNSAIYVLWFWISSTSTELCHQRYLKFTIYGWPPMRQKFTCFLKYQWCFPPGVFIIWIVRFFCFFFRCTFCQNEPERGCFFKVKKVDFWNNVNRCSINRWIAEPQRTDPCHISSLIVDIVEFPFWAPFFFAFTQTLSYLSRSAGFHFPVALSIIKFYFHDAVRSYIIEENAIF